MPSRRGRFVGLLVTVCSIVACAGVTTAAHASDPVTSFDVPNSVNHLVESTDGSAIALSTVDGHVQIRNTTDYAVANTLDLYASDLFSSALTGYFYAVTDDEIDAIDPYSGAIVHSYGELGGHVGAAAMNAAGTKLYFVDDSFGTLYVLDTFTGGAYAQTLRFKDIHVQALGERSGLLYAVLGRPGYGSSEKVCAYDPSLAFTPTAPCSRTYDGFDLRFAFTSDGGVAVGALYNSVQFYDSSLSLVTSGQADDLAQLRDAPDHERTYVLFDAGIVWFTPSFTGYGSIGSDLTGIRDFWIGAANAYVLTLADSGVGKAAQKEHGTYTVNITPTSPKVAPGAPTDVIATLRGDAVRVAFTAPLDAGTEGIDSYVATAADRTDPSVADVTMTGTGSPIDVSGLTPGHRYTFTVTATSTAGDGPSSLPADATYLAPQTVAFDSRTARQAVGSVYTASVTATGSANPVRFSLGSGTTNSACTIVSSDGPQVKVRLDHVGTCNLIARLTATGEYAASNVSRDAFEVTAGAQSVAFADLPAKAQIGRSVSVSASGTGTGPVTIAVAPQSTPSACSLDGSTLRFGATGRCVLTAVQNGNADYRTSTVVRAVIKVNRKFG